MITSLQCLALRALKVYPKTARGLATELNREGDYWGYDRVHNTLRRLENRNLVRRISDRPALWEVTATGARELKDYERG